MRGPATEIVRVLREAGYLAYFAGGWVRDLLLGHPSDDIDIATEAPPERVIELFPKTVPVGVSFGVVIVLHHDMPFEVTSFRKDGLYLYGRRPETIAFASPEEDAQRRDFTINGMFYDPMTDQVIDFVDGQEDLRRGVVRAIGNPEERVKEDRLRMLRAVRVMARFGFTLDAATRMAIERYASSLVPAVAVERIWQEFTKMTQYPGFTRAVVELFSLGLLQVIFPDCALASVAEIEETLACCAQFPVGTPAVLYIAQLFPKVNIPKLREVCERLRVSTRDTELLAHYARVRERYATQSGDSVDWVYLFAHPHAELCQAVYAATLHEPERTRFLAREMLRQQELAEPIARLRERNPVVRATHLQSEGIPNGQLMGRLLKAAERLAIERGWQNPAQVIAELKHLPLWPGNRP
jgi:poly(A) polymerase